MRLIADVDYPTGLPNPLREGHSLQPVDTFTRTPMQSGRAWTRKRFSMVPVLGTFSFLFRTDTEAALFEAWYKHTLNDGVKWFNIERKTPLGLIMLTCRFTQIYAGPTLVGRSSWRYECPLEIWERPLLPEEWLEFPEYLLNASLFDVAMNREWPEEL